MTDLKSFRINVDYLKREHVLNFEIYFNDRLIVKEDAFFINIPTLKEGIVNDISIVDTVFSQDKNPILVTGCGYFGCCPGLFWKLVHEGEFRIKLEDYRIEVLRLIEKLKRILSSNPEFLTILRKQASPLKYFL